MTRKKKTHKAVAIAAAMPQPQPLLPIPALLLRVGLILATAAAVQHFLPQL
ncbi:MAG: hypothetical protein ACT6U0_00825 [Shinella sp.]|uniref:hypothetical protein n=1 Tax=Shinella sp. TaxID=1870904 RepID=UPI0040367E4E